MNRSEGEQKLFEAIHARKGEINDLMQKYMDEWLWDDAVYRFYHHSFKVYGAQESTREIVNFLQSLLPAATLNPDFLAIVAAGTGKIFAMEHNGRWLTETRPIVEAFMHAHFFLEMAVKSSEMDNLESLLPSYWAAFLYLYNLR